MASGDSLAPLRSRLQLTANELAGDEWRAERVAFLGFSYHELNLKKLGIPDSLARFTARDWDTTGNGEGRIPCIRRRFVSGPASARSHAVCGRVAAPAGVACVPLHS